MSSVNGLQLFWRLSHIVVTATEPWLVLSAGAYANLCYLLVPRLLDVLCVCLCTHACLVIAYAHAHAQSLCSYIHAGTRWTWPLWKCTAQSKANWEEPIMMECFSSSLCLIQTTPSMPRSATCRQVSYIDTKPTIIHHISSIGQRDY